MKPHQLKAFLAVMETRGIRQAANALHLTQPAISRAIRELEDHLTVQLFQRGAQGVTPTAYGVAFEQRARLLQQEAERARDELRQMRDGQLGCVRVAVSSIPATALLPKALALFRAQLPATAIEFSEGIAPMVLPALREGQLDLALVQHRTERIGPEFECEELLTTPLVVCARVGHPRARARTLAALQNEEWLGWDRSMVENLFIENGCRVPQRIVISRSLEITRALVGQGDLISVFGRPVGDRELAHHGIRTIPVQAHLPELAVSVVTRRGAIPTPAAKKFLTAVRAAAAGLKNTSSKTFETFKE